MRNETELEKLRNEVTELGNKLGVKEKKSEIKTKSEETQEQINTQSTN